MEKPLRIGFIAPFLFRLQRGIERSCIHLAGELARMGQQVSILAWREPNGTPASPIHPRVRVVGVPYVRYYRAQWAIPFYLAELLTHRYDVLNIFFGGYGEAEVVAVARRCRPFRVNFIAGYPIEQVPHRFEEFRRWNLDRFLDRIIVKSSSMVPGVSEFFHKDVEIIPNGIDVNLFHPDQKRPAKSQLFPDVLDGDHVLLTVAALEERKGVQYVIRAMPQLMRDGLSVLYFVVGDGPHRGALETLAVECGVGDRVHFVGAVKDVVPYYRLADIFLLPSYGEGFPNVLLEAWAMALPVIVSRHPPYPQVVPEDVGFLVHEKDSTRLGRVLTDLLRSPGRRERIGIAARRYVEENYTWTAVAQQYLRTFAKNGEALTSL